MILKQRTKSNELKILRALDTRLKLLETEKNYYLNLEKGFKGEVEFDLLIEKSIPNETNIAINDFVYEINNTVFQVDSLLVSNNTIYLFEVKNFDGDYYIEKDRWYTSSDTEIKNPLQQLQRTETLLRRLLKELGFGGIVKPYLIFINPEFHLYNAPRNSQIIFPTQLNRFMYELSNKLMKTNSSDRKLSEKLLVLHLTESPYSRVPKYTYDQLTKGVYCRNCYTFISTPLVCSSCGEVEDHTTAIIRHTHEFNLLFPDDKITTKVIWEWCGQFMAKKTIHSVLSKSFKVNGYGKSRFFTIDRP
ncbi:NERD domain-containing protein [Bacillus luteolus]|uniref:NERD domain-containing protein n=1 Tax=Litchfieldia luteola TaxID=682179 RepID=A0ABR9QPI6_9BACI|nr:nuclease-related domain-containing protein [Cytobacillus luteolus]MBE4910412.1 NERD domain-containing protein [Cytobacillus luteolus]MBP1942012.1 hypothetical protein [Cytobacillus luteolus]